MSDQLPTLRWGIIATGLISSWFVQDLIINRKDAKARHIIQAIGSSSLDKGKGFVEKYLPGRRKKSSRQRSRKECLSWRQGIISSSSSAKTKPVFCTIEGSQGYVDVEGFTSSPQSFTVHSSKDASSKKYEFERPGRGFYWEADAVALDIAAGKNQNEIMPWAETIRVLELLDEIRRQGGARFPQDAEA
ncbi:hypothetical protein F5Y13DRAFT_203664 [Hypoxylon sp. FL1857]|nr:hypothetical protein F5Y13DRAFT_203664 [Hypoxylon sp. FL1857]